MDNQKSCNKDILVSMDNYFKLNKTNDTIST